MMRLMRIANEFYSTPWAVQPVTLCMMQMIMSRAMAGHKLSDGEIREAIGPTDHAPRDAAVISDNIGIIPISGMIGHRANLVRDVSSGVGTSTELVSRDFKRMLNDQSVGAIVLDVDSPGGSIMGVAELASEIFAARGRKPIVASVNALAASAAYFIASAADEIVITPTGMAGSIGVFSAHDDISAMMEMKGVKTELIFAGKFKVEGNPFEPLTAEARAATQLVVDQYYSQFVSAVAKHRGTTSSKVRNGFGEGRALTAQDSIEAGIADRIATMDQVLMELRKNLSKRGPSRSARSAADMQLQLSQLSTSHVLTVR